MSVVSPEEELAILAGMASEIDAAVLAAFGAVASSIRGGSSPRDAVADAMDGFTGPFESVYRDRLGQALGKSIGDARPLMTAAGVELSTILYVESEKLGATVTAMVDDNRRGYQSARALALELYEGYGFKPQDPLTVSSHSKTIPAYMRRLLTAPEVRKEFERAFAKAQVSALKTGALQAAYNDLIDAIDDVQDGVGAKVLDKKVQVAVEERMRYYSKRIAQTELHRNYARASAVELQGDDDVEYVQVRLSGKHDITDICDVIAGADRYGLGPGVYPRDAAPVPPYHPFCRCNVVPRLDLTGRAVPVFDPLAEQKYIAKAGVKNQAKMAGSRAKLEQIKSGRSIVDVHNDSISNQAYAVVDVGSVQG